MKLLAILLLASQVRPASIEGFVVKAGTGEPVSKANVTLSAVSVARQFNAVTAADGRFVFQNVAPESYRLSVTRNGYVNGAYGQRGPNGSGAVLKLTAGQALKDVRVAMTAMGAVSGRIFAADGEPEANVPVQALKYTYAEGQRVLMQVKVVETNDRGEYRLFWLPPGQYYIRAVPVGSLILGRPVVGGDDAIGPRNREVPVYFPSTIDLKSATPIDLRSGADYTGVDFALLHEKGRQIRGVMVDSAGQPAHNRINISLTPRDRTRPHTAANGTVDSNGRFTINGVLPGSYVLAAVSRIEGERQSGGRTFVDVGDTDLDGVVVAMAPSVDIEGQVIIDGFQQTTAEGHPVITLEKRRPNGGLLASEGALFTSNTSFRIPGVVEDDYEVRLYQLKPSQYLKSIRSGSIDVLSAGLSVDSKSSPMRLEVVIGANGGSIDGVVVNDKRQPQDEIRVTLIPDAVRRQRDDLYKKAITDGSGRFQMQGIAPGIYTLFAWDDIEDGMWLDPDFLARFEGRGARVRVDDGSRLNVEISPTTTQN